MKLITFERTCYACPSQWEGKLDDGRMLYIRYRWSHLSVCVSPNQTDNVMEAVGGEEIFSKECDNSGWDGVMSFHELQKHTAKIIDYPKDYIEPEEDD